MLIKNLFTGKKPVISFEIFPPKKDSDIETIYSTIDGLKDLNPDFISVTYGAGGSTSNKTIEIASIIKNKYYIESLAHLTSVSLSKEKLNNILTELKKNNINNILALRGDFPHDMSEEDKVNRDFLYASDLAAEIKNNGGFSIGGACYPEGHLESINLENDILNLKKKVDNGTDFLITQLFFDNELFYKFKEAALKNSITIPVSAGIMPVTSKKQIERIVELSGATLPAKFKRIMDKYEHNPQALKEAGIAYATEQIIDLLSWGIDGIHLYTMNRPETARKIIQNIAQIRNVLENTAI
jgi:methylenetetrahydrofolate reductase (NADPH)